MCVTLDPGVEDQDGLFLKGVLERDEEAVSNWVFHKLVEFDQFLGLLYEGFEAEIMELFKSIELRRKLNAGQEGSRTDGGKCPIKELKKLESNINYDRNEGGLSEGGA